MREVDLDRPDGGVLHVYDAGGGGLPLVWHHGTPNIGRPPEPLSADAQRLGLRWVGYDRPGYGGSTPRPGRDVASAAVDVATLADALDLGRYAVMGHSGGGPHALASAALHPERVVAAVLCASLAPPDAEGLDWFAGMVPSGVRVLSAASHGREARAEAEAEEYDPQFTASDLATLVGPWGWFGSVVGPGVANGPDPGIDDDVAYASRWGFGVADISAPTLLLHGTEDGIAPVTHGRWLADRILRAELREVPGAGHISVMDSSVGALEWLAEQAARTA